MKMFTIYDSISETYELPRYYKTKGEALRDFTDASNDSNTYLYKHPEHYSMFEIGEFDQRTSVIKIHEKKVLLGTAVEFKKPDNQLKMFKDESK